MLSGHNIICFSNDWDQDPLSKHHIMMRLARHNHILWVNSIGMRTPRANSHDIAKIGKKLKSFFKGCREVEKNFFVITPLVVPFHGKILATWLNSLILRAQIRFYQKRLGFNEPILWTFIPNMESAVNHLNEKLSIYYITDDFMHFTGHPAKALDRMESRLIHKSDIVIASARKLADKKPNNGKPISLVAHGVDHEHFAKALTMDGKDLPLDVREVSHPLIGFYGEISDWIDINMLSSAADLRPDWSFVLIGRQLGKVEGFSDLTERQNVLWLGHKKFEQLPYYCSAFDVALIPMKINELTLSVNPLKLREYLAAGVPVVSTPLPEVLPYADVVKFASTGSELVSAVEEWLAVGKKNVSENLSRRVEHESWDARVEEISGILQEKILEKSHTGVI